METLAGELVRLARQLTAKKITKGDVVLVDVNSAKRGMPDNEWQALKMLAPKTQNLMNVEFYDQRSGKWNVTQKGGRGSFSVPEYALIQTGEKDPSRFIKDAQQLALNFETGSTVKTTLSRGTLSVQYTVRYSAPPMTAESVSRIADRMRRSVSSFLRGVSGLFEGAKTTTNPYIHLAGQSKSISFLSEFSVSVKPTEANLDKLEILVDAIST